MNLIVKYNNKQFKVPLISSADNGNDAITSAAEEEGAIKYSRTLGELRELVANQTGCDIKTMKLLWKGKAIVMPMEEPIENFNFKENDKIMVIGKSTVDPGFVALTAYEKNNLTKLNGLFGEIEKDLAELERNFLEGDILNEMMKRMEKRIKEFTEKSLRHLESLDALELYTDNMTDEQKKKNREKRKTMVDGVQTLLRDNDKFLFRLEQYKKSLEFPDL